MCRLHVVPEPVDVDFFNPAGVTPLELPLGKLVFGQARSETKTVAFLSVSHYHVFAPANMPSTVTGFGLA